MSKSKNKFKNVWKNQKELGLIYGKSAIAIGKALIDLGLRNPDTKAPTDIALKDGIAMSANLKDGTPFYLWHKQLTCEKLDTLWQKQSHADRQCQQWAIDYAAAINAALRADDAGEHHVLVDGCYDEAVDIAKAVTKAGDEAISSFNAKLKGKIPNWAGDPTSAQYLIGADVHE
jgi:hypothetical protein